MAGESQIQSAVSASKGGVSINTVGSTSPASKTHDVAGADMAQFSQVIGTGLSGEALNIPADISPVGLIHINNTDSTNYLDVSTSGASEAAFNAARFGRIRAGHRPQMQPMPGVTWYFRANGADVRIHCAVLEE